MAQPAITPNKWNDLLGQLNSAQNFYRPKAGKTRFRLVRLPEMKAEPGMPFQFYQEVTTTFRGKTKSRFVLPVLIFEGEGARPEQATTVTPLITTKTVIKAILGLLAEGYDLFDVKDGYGLSISRTGTGLDTDYSVMPSKSPVPLPKDLAMPEKTLEQMADEFEKWANRPGSPGQQPAGDGQDW